MLTKVTAWLATMPSTALTIGTGLGLSVLFVGSAILLDAFGRPLAERTLGALQIFLTTLVAGGVVQFSAKRATEKAELRQTPPAIPKDPA